MEYVPHRLIGQFLPMMILTLLFLCFSSSQALKFNVGGKDGWVVNPSEDYNHWSQRNRFQVNDTLYFKYKKGSDSVLMVNKPDYDSCNTNNPIEKMDGGDSTLTLDKSGPLFFISGNSENCKKGQKLMVLVLAIRRRVPSPPPMVAPAPAGGGPPAPVGGNPPAPASGSPPAVLPRPGEGPTAGDNYQWPPPPPAAPSGSTRFGSHGVGIILLLGCFVGLV